MGQRTLRAVCGVGLLAIAPGPVADAVEGGTALEQRIRTELEALIQETHRRPSAAEHERILHEARERWQGSAPSAASKAWLLEEIERSFLSFARSGALHDPTARYRLPFDLRVPRIVSQGVNGNRSHQGLDAFDFLMPVGTPVLAARAGTVIRVVDGFTEGRLDEAHRGKSNLVFVLHSDGTFASYAHLEPGIPVVESQQVRPGEPIARSGDTGYSDGPHLHFDVNRRMLDGRMETVPIRFQLAGQGFVPKEKEYWGMPPKPNVQLRVSVDGKPTEGPRKLVLRRGASAQLKVEAALPSGSLLDVTAHPRTDFESLTLWSMSVDRSGRATVRPSPGFERGHVDGDLVKMGKILVLHGTQADPLRGYAIVDFEIVD